MSIYYSIEKYGQVKLTAEAYRFIEANWKDMTNPALAAAMGLRLTRLRNELQSLGLKRMEMEYWSEVQIEFLIDNYEDIGDVELAEIFSSKWKKNKGWTKKHIEKKRRYLNLKRTNKQINDIHARNVSAGRFRICVEKMWKVRGVSEVGTIKISKGQYDGAPYPIIKTEGGFVHYYRWLYVQHNGELPSDILVVPKQGLVQTGLHNLEDLETIDRAEHARRNSHRRMQYPEDLRRAIRLVKKLNKELKTDENEQSK